MQKEELESALKSGLMAQTIFTIKKRSIFEKIRENGRFLKGENINLQILNDQYLNNTIGIGYTATKRIGNAVKRNKAKRIMRELAKKIIRKDKTNIYYVLIAKPSLLDTSFEELIKELRSKINEK